MSFAPVLMGWPLKYFKQGSAAPWEMDSTHAIHESGSFTKEMSESSGQEMPVVNSLKHGGKMENKGMNLGDSK